MRWTQRILLAAAFTALAFTQAVAQNSLRDRHRRRSADADSDVDGRGPGGSAQLRDLGSAVPPPRRPGPNADDGRRRRLRSVAGQVLDPTRLGDAGFRARSPRAVARRRAGDRTRRAVHHGPGAEPRDCAPRREAPAVHHIGRGRGRADRGLPLLARVRRTALRRDLSHGDAARAPSRRAAAGQPCALVVRCAPRRQRPVPLGPAAFPGSWSSLPPTTSFSSVVHRSGG